MWLSATPRIAQSIAGKQFYIKRAKSSKRDLNYYLRDFELLAKKYVASGLTPGAGYVGVWLRDSSYILTEILEQRKIGEAVGWMQWIWGYQLSEGIRGMYGRGSPETRFKAKKIDDDVIKRFEGGMPTSIHRGYCEVYGVNPDIDSTALQISSTCKIIMAAGSEELFFKMYPRVQKAIKYLRSRDLDGDSLLEQCGNEDWMDNILRSGNTVYSQALWIDALHTWSKLLLVFGRKAESECVSTEARNVSEAVDSLMWSGKSYVDRLDSDDRKDAITQDVVCFLRVNEDNQERNEKTLKEITHKLWRPLGPACIDPPIRQTGPSKYAPLRYQNGGSWPWITALEIDARTKIGQKGSARELIEKVLPFAALEWLEPYSAKHTGRYPFRTSLSAVLSTLRSIKKPFDSALVCRS